MLIQSIKNLDLWIQQNGWKGYDPYDIKAKKIFLFFSRCKYSDFFASKILEFTPIFFRKIFRVEKEINPKAMGLFARGYLQLFKKTNQKYFLLKARECLNWLEQNSYVGYHGICWGYPFDWQSRIFIPKGTPSGVVTSTAAHAFLDAYEILKEKNFLKSAESCCDFILNDLNIDKKDDDKICFSYTPLDSYHVHNANLLSASVLIRTYDFDKKNDYKKYGINAINFTMKYQNPDGSWYYWAPPDKLDYRIDNYHTGFVLESLNICRRILKNEFEYTNELERGLDFYAKNLFLKSGIAKMENNSIYPVDIHSCAQGIITFAELKDLNSDHFYLADKIAKWTTENLQDKKGFFYYRMYKSGFISKIPFIRWGQAWIFRALSYLGDQNETGC